jgi:arylsulfatase
MPTMLDLAGQTAWPDWRGRESPEPAGVSLAPALREDRVPDREYIFFRHIGHRALRVGKWKLVAVHHGRWELYDMEADRSELHNVARKYPERVARMAALWERCHRTFIEQSGEERD